MNIAPSTRDMAAGHDVTAAAVQLSIEAVSKRFGGVAAVDGVSIDVPKGRILSIIGPNGAGKTSLLNLVSGFYKPDRGRVIFKGRDVTRLSVHQRAALGLGRTFQNVGLVKGSTVRENLLTAQYLEADYSTLSGMLGAPRTFSGERELRQRADAIAEVMGLGDI
ncbi:MAG TPA: ATP-binding cassette domain-containing protein, partial [Hyphomicrobiaceae bacterium]|nr:ATP-binding cassette domain-containing protein [Hyphomicrobiaceae bacterium]